MKPKEKLLFKKQEIIFLITKIMKWLDLLENFYFKYFSGSTADSKDGWVRYVVYGIMFIPLVLGLFFTVIGLIDLARFFGLVLMWMLLILAVPWIVVYFYHNHKLKNLGKKWK